MVIQQDNSNIKVITVFDFLASRDASVKSSYAPYFPGYIDRP